ncbi:cytosolic sulfotransferase 12-like [Coffea eugenioides]|uniref:cytosolic sulfotransferase 12-like n=1 Tax=Coffea eugenioides TaxID=49369 RepID=UPI000F612B38|nr:cytosolic sulfotransferase 12-like [Coffea eugenioides]
MPLHTETSSTPLPPKYLQDDKLTQECEELLPSLPKEKGWVSSYLYQYRGFWHSARQLQGVIACQKHFEAQDSDIFLVTTPKSGTTWLKALLFALVNRMQCSFMEQHPLLMHSPHELVPYLDSKIYVENQTPDLSSFTSPRLFATHLPLVSLPQSVHDCPCKIVYLCRDPKDTFVSLWHFANKLRLENMESNSLEDVFDRFCKGVSAYGPFWDHVLGYWKESLKNPDKVLFLKYEDLKEKPTSQLKKISDFLGYPFSTEEEASGLLEGIIDLCSFDKLSNLEVNKSGKLSSGEENKAFFRRGEVGDWMKFLNAKMVARLNSITQQKFDASGLKL